MMVDMLKQRSIRSNKKYYTLFVIVLLTLNVKYPDVAALHFTVVIYGRDTKSQHLIC